MASQTLGLSLDPAGPLPLYHQIAVALRYRIATGRLEPGERLPPLRDAAGSWGVNYHTVRKAYGLLEEMGLVERRRGAGTHVTASGLARGSRPDDELNRFLTGIAEQAQGRFGLSPEDLARALAAVGAVGESAARDERATVVECNLHQCRDLASQLARRFELEVAFHLLGSSADLPLGPLIGTHFHLIEMRRAWPERNHEMYFPAVHPDPALRSRLEPYASPDGPLKVPLCEREASLGAAMAEDVQLLLSADAFEVVPEVALDPGQLLSDRPGLPVLVAPRVWNDLDRELRARPELIEVRYRFRERDLNAIAGELGWEVRSGANALQPAAANRGSTSESAKE